MPGLLSNGHVKLDAPCWREGQAEWLPIKEVEELQGMVAVIAEVQQVAKKPAA